MTWLLAPAQGSRGSVGRVGLAGRARQAGFTLVEALIALALFAMMGTVTMSTLTRTIDVRERATTLNERHQEIRQGLTRMAREISMAFLSHHRDCADPRTKTIFQMRRASFGDKLDFTGFGHVVMQTDANASDVHVLGYSVEADGDNHQLRHVMRREKHRLDDNPERGGSQEVLIENVLSLHFRFYDLQRQRWEDDWDSTSRDTRARLPKFVAITLKVPGAGGKEESFTTKTRIFVQQALLYPGLLFSPCLD